ncbi:MAG: hypothetical protein ABSC71_07960 [Candidatus Acidiferrales bacterium]
MKYRFISLLALACACALMPSASFAGNAAAGGNKERHDDKAARPVGHVVQTVDAEVDQSKLTVGTTLYNGDTITTAADGSMLASLRSSQLAMDPSSQAALELCTDELHVLVYYGTVNFTAAAADHVEFIISQGIVKPLDGQTASGRISVVSEREAVVSATHGSLVVDDDGKRTTISEGQSYRITLGGDPRDYAPSTGCAGAEQNTKMIHPTQRNLIFDLIVAGGAAGAGYALWQLNTVSPSKPE